MKDSAIFAAKKAGYLCQVSFVYVKITNYVNRHSENLRLDIDNTGNLEFD